MYRREGAHRVQEARLAPSDGTDTDLFARSVAISGDYVVASPMGAEAAYVFRRDETGWVEDAKLVAWDADAHTVWLLNLDCATPGRPEKTEYVLDTTAEGRYAYIGSNCGAEVRGDRIMSLRRIIIMLNAVTAGQGAMS